MSRSLSLRPGLARLATLTLALCLGGCAILSPLPTWELIKAGGTAASTALASGPAKAVNTVHHGDAPVSELCIEFNRQVPAQDLVPALQAELRQQGVASRVYEAGSGVPQCRHWLRYVASIDWAMPPMGSAYQSYLSSAVLSLHKDSGELMASSAYAVDEQFGVSRWSSTRRKLAPAVKALITGFES